MDPTARTLMTQTPLLSAKGLSAHLPGDSGLVRVLDGLDLEVEAGEVVDIVGPSGSGKSTLVRALARLLPGVEGSLVLRGESSDRISAQVWRTRVALLPQRSVLVGGTVRENLLLGFELKVRAQAPRPDDAALRDWLVRAGLTDVELERDAVRLSVGQQARVALLRTCLTSPDVLLLDEPDAALDPDSARAIRELAVRIVASGTAIVRVRHREDDGLAARRLWLEDGRLREVER